MKRSLYVVIVLFALTAAAWPAAMGTAAGSVIPADVQQIISVDYRSLENSPTALALRDRVMPDNLKQFEAAIKNIGVDPDHDMDTLTFASFRTPKKNLLMVGIAQGQFGRAKVLKKMRAQKIRGARYRTSFLYPMNGGMEMAFLDDWTLLFGDDAAVKFALATRDGENASFNSNRDLSDMVQSVNSGTVWSILDAQGTQNMLRSTLGDAARLADYDTVKKRLLGSVYTMDFNNGVDFDLNVLTTDNMTASTLSSLIKAGMLYKKMTATPIEQSAMDSITVDSDNTKLRIHFKSDDQKFQALLHSDLFAAISR